MELNELKKYHKEAIGHVLKHKLYNAFMVIQKMVKVCSNSDFQNRFENQFTTYQNMLKYAFEYKEDPEREKVYNHLVVSLIKLIDALREEILNSGRLKSYYSIKDQVAKYYNIDEQDSSQLVDSITFEKEIEDILSETVGVTDKSDQDFESSRTRFENIFKYLWLTDSFHNTEVDLVKKIVQSVKLPWYNKSLIVSAITLSLLRFFDEKKFIVLFDLSENAENQVWQRAFIGLVLCLMFYDKRLKFYPEIQNRLKVLQGNKLFIKNLELFSIQYIWQKESEKIAKRINEELMPDMLKMKSIIEEKLDLDNIVSNDPLKDKNPDWEDYFKDSPDIYKKFEEIQNLQTEGADIFMGAFSMLKQFPFFKEISNWFLPFYVDNKSVKDLSKELDDKKTYSSIIEKLESTFFLCNSDKYSFAHNLKFVLQMQNKGMMEMFNSELDAMNELAVEDQKIDENLKNKYVFTQYLQDLYRFFMLYSDKHEFENVFNLKTDLHSFDFMKDLTEDTDIIHKIGAFYFNQDYYDKALEIFQSLIDKDKSVELLEKIAYCHQRLGNIESAIVNYGKALLIERNKKWILQQLAYCHRKMGDYREALKYYRELEKENPDDLNIQADIGHAYLGIEDYESALQYYFKVEYLAPENKKVWRPLAWCSFVLGKLDAAKKYFEKLMTDGNNKNDLVNFGHVMWCLGHKDRAISCYIQGLKMADKDYKWFERVMKEDSRHLQKHNINPFDVYLMVDYIKMHPED